MTPLSFPPQAASAQHLQLPAVSGEPISAVCTFETDLHVGEFLRRDLSEQELESHIVDCGRQIERAMARWERHGDFADRGEADKWKCLMYQATGLRSPEQVRKLELERRLA